MSGPTLFYVDVERANTVVTTYAVKADNIADACAVVDAAIKGDVLHGLTLVGEIGTGDHTPMISGVRRIGGLAP